MNHSNIRRMFAALFLLVLLAAAFPVRAVEAASLSSDIGKLERYAEQLEQTIHSRQLSKPYALYNKAKKSYYETKRQVEQLKEGEMKQRYRERLKAVNRTIVQASYYIRAMESGERLLSDKSHIEQSLALGKVETVYDAYASFDQQLKKTKALIQKVSGSSVRQKMTNTFVRPAEAAKQRAFYPMNIMLAFDGILTAYEQEDIAKAERLLLLCEQWLPHVKDAKAKAALSRYLEEFQAPVILEVQ
ncbi:anion-transporting ArsA/GET3 family ATPase [Anoxybacillus voinovskiensis]|uniref:Anion-transporting ArsA/GET3 family ATPase n=1 Tax=Anoxybacteroides voinovskiense TaxID=230470 RepID=A0A840DQA9_9BACL|nr:hypothetical protein [Anoxybacillus voinovskiensis]MBB4073795.1 anion-transporting ArsA/GET3 family ATPase [Anoxybacillus voinovskiensis]GGJ63860.1 hypothetical protein GCM10008982_11350 [Anoxybacillus voinovskiensis]